ncbi:cytochrome P450 3A5-like isoform X2 [Littorina saxatilis]|uniref:cytochrome P450 3A5-like isoform X2 n=1 Tax=Littorina saxatilis TaxID=31220 RepID=UPI0038B6008B
MAVDHFMSCCSFTSVLVVGVISLMVYWFWRSQQYLKTFEKSGIPGPRPMYVLGNLRQLFKGGFCDQLFEWNKEFGRIYGMYLHPSPVVVVSNLDLLRDVFVKKFTYFHNRMPQKFLQFKPFEDNLLQLRDDNWKLVRSKLSPTFSSGKLKKMMPAIDRVVKNLGNHVKAKAESGEVVDLKEIAGGFAMDTIAGAAFGMQVDTLSNPKDPFNVNVINLFKPNKWLMPIIMLFPCLATVFRKMGVSFLSVSSTNFFVEVLEMALKERRLDKKSYGDFLQLLVEAQKGGDQSKGAVDAEIDFTAQLQTAKDWNRTAMNDDEIKANALVFLLAGYDTTSTVLSSTLFHLAANPECLRKAQQEVDEKGTVNYDSAGELTYVDMCMNEAMRLFPPLFVIDREIDEDVELGEFKLKKGWRMVVPCYSIHRDPEYWTDPLKYDPERHTPEAKAKRHPFAFMPFGFGPRNCIGMRLAQLEIRMAIATILQHYAPILYEKSVYPPVVEMPQTRMVAKDGLWIKFKHRE